jgi:CheY-like chemotaxis protein
MQSVRKTVLVVDDNRLTRLMVVESLSAHFEVLSASDGLEALGRIDAQPVDLVLTDLHMPNMDGFELIAALVRHQAKTPVVVMTSMPLGVAEASLGSMHMSHVLQKPLALDALPEYLRRVIGEATTGRLVGMSLASLLQVLAIEKKTCTMRVSENGREGLLYLSSGAIIDAKLGEKSGLAAALEIVTWERPSIEMEGSCHATRAIDVPVERLLLEAMRRKDEAAAQGTEPSPSEALESVDAWAEWTPSAPTPTSEEHAAAPIRAVPTPPAERLSPAIADVLAKLVRVAGASSACIVDAETGLPLGVASGARSSGDSSHLLGDLLRSSSRLARSYGANAAEEVIVAEGDHYHLLRPLRGSSSMCAYLILKRRPESLVVARNLLARLDEPDDSDKHRAASLPR